MTAPTIASGTGVRTMTAPADTVASLPVVRKLHDAIDALGNDIAAGACPVKVFQLVDCLSGALDEAIDAALCKARQGAAQ